jgi:hypothetical protein
MVTPVVASLLDGVSAAAPAAFGGVPIVLCASAALATLKRRPTGISRV